MTTVDLLTTVEQVIDEARIAAQTATNNYLLVHGERDCCGFAWVKTYVKGNTRLGRALLKAGFKKRYEGGMDWWNPSGNPTQCITAKEEGAIAAAKILSEKLGAEFYAGSRMD